MVRRLGVQADVYGGGVTNVQDFLWWKDLAIPASLGFVGGATSHLLGRRLWKVQASRAEATALAERRRSAAKAISENLRQMDACIAAADDEEWGRDVRPYSMAIQTEAFVLEHERLATAIRDAAWSAEHAWIGRCEGESALTIARESLDSITGACEAILLGKPVEEIECGKPWRANLGAMHEEYYGH